ncbi:MAG: shikimate dehydrogenase [candidate division Zixibacteria bacterium]|nr:shikimate dehydrogenase [candidate division Zixibacteria bacterium]
MSDDLKFGLIGNNVHYSKSPDIFQAIFKLIGKTGSFEIFTIHSTDLGERLKEIVGHGFTGLSVTIPYKSQIIPLLEDIDPIAQTVDAVNSVAVSKGQLHGYNTDCHGFCIPLREYTDKLKYKTALILGCGGAARAVVYALHVDFEVNRFIVYGRSAEKLQVFKDSLEGRMKNIEIQLMSPMQETSLAPENVELMVNCTPVGGWNQDQISAIPSSFSLQKGSIYYDLNYNEGNKSIRQATEMGLITVDGSAMLVGQALKSFDIWAGQSAPFEPIYSSVFGRESG